MPRTAKTTVQSHDPEGLRPYIHHGIELEVRNNHGVGDCPLCTAEGKFSVDCDTGLWRCWVCGGGTEAGGGNALTFIRLLHAAAVEATGQEFYEEVARDRRLLSPKTVAAWGVCHFPSAPLAWLVPGYGPDGALDQLYRRTRIQKASGEWVWSMLPTPGVWPEGRQHALHMAHADYDTTRSALAVCEGPWDGMALWEVLDGELGECNVVAVPGCQVWRDDWSAMCQNKAVAIFFDSDHPRRQGVRVFTAGYDGVVRIAKRLSGYATSVMWLRWGKDGYDPDLPDGHDLRDALSGKPGPALSLKERKEALAELLGKMEHASPDWFAPNAPHVGNGKAGTSLETRSCDNLEECERAWRDAMYWRSDLSDVLKVTLAVCASTRQSGNQLFLDVVGSPGVAKSTILRGALASNHCVHVENITKLLSGYKMPGDEKKDCSFIARANNKTWITCEFDTILVSPQYHELMGKMRRIFDGETTATYGNSDEDRHYKSLRTPWIRAGTWKMMEQDQSQLGDRFLRITISDPTEEEKYDILCSSIMSERSAMLEQVSSSATSIVDEKTRKAYALMGGYVDWLMANVNNKLPVVEANMTREDVYSYARLADLSSYLRARPNEDKRKKENSDGKECPTRLAKQYCRLGNHLSVVLNVDRNDYDVFRTVKKVALDTSCGHTLNIIKWLSKSNNKAGGKTHQECGGIPQITLATWCNMPDERIENYLMFLRKIGVLQLRRPSHGGPTWLMTDRLHELYEKVIGGEHKWATP